MLEYRVLSRIQKMPAKAHHGVKKSACKDRIYSFREIWPEVSSQNNRLRCTLQTKAQNSVRPLSDFYMNCLCQLKVCKVNIKGQTWSERSN